MAFCFLYRPLSSLWTSAPSTALCPLYSPLSPLQLSVPLQLYVLSTLSPLCLPPFSPTVSPFLCLPLLSLHHSLSLCLMSLTSGYFPSIFPLCLFPIVSFFYFSPPVPSVTPSAFSL
jgi:hypothetical protein